MRTRKHFKFESRKLDTDLFDELYTILRVSICHGNRSQVAKLLDISRLTAIRWETNPPTHWWWTKLLEHLIDTLSDELIHGTSKAHRQYGYRAKREIQPFKRQLRTPDGVEQVAPDDTINARRHMLYLLGEYGQITSRQLKKPKYSGGYSMSHLRQAIKSLELDRETRGFGEDKITVYMLPRTSE